MAWPYLKPGDVGLYVDTRVLPQLAADLGEGMAPPSYATVTTGGDEYNRIVEGLKWGAAEIDSALRSGGKYNAGHLKVLAEVIPMTADELARQDYGTILRKLNAALLVQNLQERKVRAQPEAEAIVGLVKWGREKLERLRSGEDLLPAPTSEPADSIEPEAIAVNEGAGLPSMVSARPDTGDPWLPRRGWPSSRDHDRITQNDRFTRDDFTSPSENP